MKHKFPVLFGVLAIALISYLVYSAVNAPVYLSSSGSAINIDSDPVQTTDTETILPPIGIGKNKFFFTVKAAYKIRGRLVGKRHYLNGFMSRLSPFDYSLIWGEMPAMLPYLKFSNAKRFCFYRYKDASKVDKNYVDTHMSNNHMIPSNKNIRRALKTVRKSDLVEIEGYLVNVMANIKGKGTTNWNTSVKRTDTGDGACEIVYVKRLRIGDKLYE